MAAEFQVKIIGLDALVAKLREAPQIAAPILQRALSASQAILAKHTVKGVVPWRTGFLVQSFRAEQTAGMLRWFPTASYARFVQFGTKPHVILPKNKKALHWGGDGGPVVKRVNHPGTKANPFLERIVDASQQEVDATFIKALEQITQAIAAK